MRNALGKISKDEHTIVYSEGKKHEKGVGVILNQHISSCFQGYWALSDRVLLLKLKGYPFNISIIQAYSPTMDAVVEELDKFYEIVDKA